MNMDEIKNRTHELYWQEDLNCAATMLTCLGEIFGIKFDAQVLQSVAGLHGTNRFGGQCGLVDGALLFIGIYYRRIGKSEAAVIAACHHYAEAFHHKFGSLCCCDLRSRVPAFNDDPRYLCEVLTRDAVAHVCNLIQKAE